MITERSSPSVNNTGNCVSKNDASVMVQIGPNGYENGSEKSPEAQYYDSHAVCNVG